jgi:hypothetical protein
VRPNPKFAPEARSKVLFGPGVIEVAKQKVTSAIDVVTVISSVPTLIE